MRHHRTYRRKHHSKTSRRHTRKGGRAPPAAAPAPLPRASMTLEAIRQQFEDFKNRHPIPKPIGRRRRPTGNELSNLKQLRDEADYVLYNSEMVGNQQKKNNAKSLGDEIEVYEDRIYAEYR
jgi:hypothetical protein